MTLDNLLASYCVSPTLKDAVKQMEAELTELRLLKQKVMELEPVETLEFVNEYGEIYKRDVFDLKGIKE